MSAVKNVMKNNYRNMELNEYLATNLKDAGYGGVDVQKTPIGTRITLYVTRPGLVIGRKGVGIKDLTSRLEQNFGLTNPQISVLEVSVAGKLRSERAHFEKHSAGIIPKSGDIAERVVKVGVTHVLTKMGLMGIQLKIALKDEVPQEFEHSSVSTNTKQQDVDSQEPIAKDLTLSKDTTSAPTAISSPQGQTAVMNGGNANGQA